ncbi:MAG: MFS transporter [Promethearchaeota archaeon]
MNDKKTFQKISFFAIFTLLMILLFSYADQNLLGPFLNPHLEYFFGSTDNINVPKMTYISSAFVFISSISMVAFAILADKTTRKWVLFAGTIIYSIFSIIVIFVPSGESGYVFFFITRIMNGIGIGAIVPTIFSMVGDVANPKKRTIAFAYVNVAIILGQLIGMVLGGLMGDVWRTTYLVIGIISLILGLGLIIFKEPKRGASEDVFEGLEGAEYNFRISKDDFKRIWTNKSNFWLIANFIDCIPSGLIFFLIFKYLEDTRNMAPEMTTTIVFIAFISGIGGALVFGYLGDKWFKKDRRAKVMIALICNGFPVIFFIIFILTDFSLVDNVTFEDAFATKGFLLAMGSLILLMFINQGVGPNWHSTLTDVNLPENRGTMISLASAMDLIGHTVGPLIGGAITTSVLGLQGAMWAAILFWILNIFLWLPVFRYIEGDLDSVQKTLTERADKLKSQNMT